MTTAPKTTRPSHPTTAENPYALFFSNLGYYSSKSPFKTVDAALDMARLSGLDSAVYSNAYDDASGAHHVTLEATYNVVSGVQLYG